MSEKVGARDGGTMEASQTRKRARPSGSTQAQGEPEETDIAYLREFLQIKESFPEELWAGGLFSEAEDEERRRSFFQRMCIEGAALRETYAWAIPDERALRIIKHFQPIVEIGAGSGYWAKLLQDRGSEVAAYDRFDAEADGTRLEHWTEVLPGGPEVLQQPENASRTLLLCYPDDYEHQQESVALRCLDEYSGTFLLHIGELFGDLCPSRHHRPWGRTSDPMFQQQLFSSFHCILRARIPRWPVSRDTLTVWKRTPFARIPASWFPEDSEGGTGRGPGSLASSRASGGGEAAADSDDAHGSARQPLESAGAEETPALAPVPAPAGEGRAAQEQAQAQPQLQAATAEGGGQEGLAGSDEEAAASDEEFADVPQDEMMPEDFAAPCLEHLLLH